MADIVLTGDTSGAITVAAPAVAGTNTLTLPANTGTLMTSTYTSGDVDIDSGTLHVDATNNRVGIGTGSPTTKLSISGTGGQRIDIANTSLTDAGEIVSFQWDNNADFTIQGRDSTGGFKANWYRITSTATDGLADEHIWYTGSSTERMRIDSSGLVGIGTSSPGSELHVVADDVSQSWSPYDGTVLTIENNDTDGCILQIVGRNTATNEIWFGDDDSRNIGRIRYDHSDDGLEFWTNGSERMRIQSTGDVLVGTTSDIAAGSEGVEIKGNLGYISTARNATTGASHHLFYNPNGIVGSIQTSGTTTSYVTSSDYRLKEKVSPMSNSIDRLKQLKPSTWSWKIDGSHGEGFLAHEAQTVVPECAIGTKDAMRTEEYEVTPAVEATYDEEDNELTPAVEAVMGTREVPDYQGIDQSKLVPLLTAALQEAIQRIEALENA